MTRTIWTAAVLGAAIATGAMLFSQPQLSEADRSPAPASGPVASVQVRHDVVVVPMPAPIKYRGPHSSPKVTSVSASAAVRVPDAARARQGRVADPRLLAKVGRAVAGDGRYRPEPFPRVR